MIMVLLMGAEAKSVEVYLPIKIAVTTKYDDGYTHSETQKYKNTVLKNKKISSETDGAKTVYTYNKKGAVTALTRELYGTGTREKYAEFTNKYDQYDRIISWKRTQKAGGKIYKYNDTYKYIDKMSGDTLVSYVCYNKDQSEKTVISLYTSGACKGLVKSEVLYSKESGSKKYVKRSESQYSYKLDSHKNKKSMTTKSCSYDNGELVSKSVTTEKYTYKKYTLK